MEAFKSLEKLNNDSILMSLLEEQELNDYCQRAAMVEQKQLGFDEGEKKKQIEIAKNMLSKGTEINFISECTGLTKEELEHLN